VAALLRTSNIVLRDDDLILRPLTEHDWPPLYRWNRDLEVLWFTDRAAEPFSLSKTQEIYRTVSQQAHCFIIKCQGRAIGECWLQRMNMARILSTRPDEDCRRIDLAIGESRWRGRGLGTRVIGMLVRFAFEDAADTVFGIVGEHNRRSIRAFEKNGFREVHREPDADGAFMIDLALSRTSRVSPITM